jgi:hypothetical protein
MRIFFLLAYLQYVVILLVPLIFLVLFFLNIKTLKKFINSGFVKFTIITLVCSSVILFIFYHPVDNLLKNYNFTELTVERMIGEDQIKDEKTISKFKNTINRHKFVRNSARTFDGEYISLSDATIIYAFGNKPERMEAYIFDKGIKKSMIKIYGMVYEAVDNEAFNNEILEIVKR